MIDLKRVPLQAISKTAVLAILSGPNQGLLDRRRRLKMGALQNTVSSLHYFPDYPVPSQLKYYSFRPWRLFIMNKTG